ncbi:hypothetical protein DIPPA_21739 [Diplonema papillatum]|nr:hypothetical protein DIPPA_21739 [Diplonema papillatum]
MPYSWEYCPDCEDLSWFWRVWLVVRFVSYLVHQFCFWSWVREVDILTCIECRPTSDSDMQYNISTFSLSFNNESEEVGDYGNSERFQYMSVVAVGFGIRMSVLWALVLLALAAIPFTRISSAFVAVLSVLHLVFILPYIVATVGVYRTIQEMRATAEGTVVAGPVFAIFLVATITYWAIGPSAEWSVCSLWRWVFGEQDESEGECLLSAGCEEGMEEVEMDDGRWSPYDEDVRTDARPGAAWEKEDMDDGRWTHYGGTGARPGAAWVTEEMDDGQWTRHDEDVQTDARPGVEWNKEEMDDGRWTHYVGTGARPGAAWATEEMDDGQWTRHDEDVQTDARPGVEWNKEEMDDGRWTHYVGTGARPGAAWATEEMDDGQWTRHDEDVRTNARPGAAWEKEEMDDGRWTQHGGTGARPGAPSENEEMGHSRRSLPPSAGNTAEVLGVGAHARAVRRRRLLSCSSTGSRTVGAADATSPRIQGQKECEELATMSALSVPQMPSRAGPPQRLINWGAGNDVAPQLDRRLLHQITAGQAKQPLSTSGAKISPIKDHDLPGR